MSKGQNIENGHVCCQIKYAFTSQNTVDQRNSEKSTVGINGSKTLQGVIRIVFCGDQNSCGQNSDKMRSNTGCKSKQKPAYKPFIKVRLVNGQNHAGIDDHQKEPGNGFISILADNSDSEKKNGEQHDEQHFQKLIKNKYKQDRIVLIYV